MQDVDGDEQDDQLDETWCLFDSLLRDDDINIALASLAEGVRILMLSHSCHSCHSCRSGTVSRGIAVDRDEELATASTAKRLALDAAKRESRNMRSSTAQVGWCLSRRSRPPEF